MKISKENTKKFPGIYLVILLVIIAFLVGGCKSKKKLVEKKVETVSVLEKNDIKSSEKIKVDVSTITVLNNQSINISPFDSSISSKVIYKGDTLSFLNAKVVIENNSSTETKQDKTETERDFSDQGSTSSKTVTKEKKTDIKKTGTHPLLIWGGLLLLLLVGAFFYFKKQIPFV